MSFGDKLVEKLVFGRSGLNSSVFEKILISYSCISFMKYFVLRSYCKKIALFLKNLSFPDFLIDRSSYSTDQNCDKNIGLNLLSSIGARLMLDRSNLFFYQSKLNFDWSKFGQWVFLKRTFLTCSSFYLNFLNTLLTLFFVRPNLSLFCHFLP